VIGDQTGCAGAREYEFQDQSGERNLIGPHVGDGYKWWPLVRPSPIFDHVHAAGTQTREQLVERRSRRLVHVRAVVDLEVERLITNASAAISASRLRSAWSTSPLMSITVDEHDFVETPARNVVPQGPGLVGRPLIDRDQETWPRELQRSAVPPPSSTPSSKMWRGRSSLSNSTWAAINGRLFQIRKSAPSIEMLGGSWS
jgi:hypothetical protein